MAPAMTMSRHDDFIDDLPLFPGFQLLKPTAQLQRRSGQAVISESPKKQGRHR
jgi:hypothetical protein